jgi:hypothetical protein
LILAKKGLKSVFLRLKMLYKKAIIYSIYNKEKIKKNLH